MTKCIVCGVAAEQKCAGCSLVFYCGRDHQISDWKNGHKKNCKPFEVKRNDKLGRYMIAARNLKAGDVLFREYSVAFGPKLVSVPICLGCQKNIDIKPSKSPYKCSKCNWPLCSKMCENLQPHQEECRLMATKKFKCPIQNCGGASESAYGLILPLRVLLLRKNDPETFEKVMQLESHMEERSERKSNLILKDRLVPFIQKMLGPDYSANLIMTVAGILETNCFEICLMSQNRELGGLFLLSLILSHDCIPNTKHFVNDDFQMTFQTTVPVKKGGMLTTTYTPTLKTTLERRLHLKQAKCFDCDCQRCQDSTEFTTFGSAFRCSKCSELVISENPLNNLANWTCRMCKSTYSFTVLNAKLNQMQKELENINKRSPSDCEEYLKRNEGILAPTHSLMIEVKYMLCLLYGNLLGFHYKDLPFELLQRKILLCQDVLKVYDILDPGETNQRSNVLFELNCAVIMDVKLKLARREIDRKETQIIISRAMQTIQECYEILLVEPEYKRIMDKRLHTIMQDSLLG